MKMKMKMKIRRGVRIYIGRKGRTLPSGPLEGGEEVSRRRRPRQGGASELCTHAANVVNVFRLDTTLGGLTEVKAWVPIGYYYWW